MPRPRSTDSFSDEKGCQAAQAIDLVAAARTRCHVDSIKLPQKLRRVSGLIIYLPFRGNGNFNPLAINYLYRLNAC
jgi:hypothetical protein